MADSLLQLRQCLAASQLPIPTADGGPTEDLAVATHLSFTYPTSIAFPLSQPTRFQSSNGAAVDLRSIYFAYKHKDDPIPEYIASAEALNNSLGSTGTVQILAFVERLDLITWLEGASDTSENIKPLEGDVAGDHIESQLNSTVTGTSGIGGLASQKQGQSIDPRLQEIYNNERKMGDRNSVLRGINPTVG